jgi:prolycopene isomerase
MENRREEDEMKDKYDVIIIGAGMGGLSCGAWLAHKGMRILVLEQNAQPGGFCSSYRRNGFNFTPAASLMSGATNKNGFFLRLIERLNIKKEIEFLPLKQGYQVHLPDFNYYIYGGGEYARQRFIEQLIELFPHEKTSIKAFFDTLIKIYEQINYATFLGTKPMDLARIIFKCPTVVQHAGENIGQFVNDYVKDPKLKTALSINSTCANLPPSKMSVLAIAGLLIEVTLDSPHVKGGAQAISEAFAKSIKDNGGEVVLGRRVEEILVEGNKAFGVRVVNSPLSIPGGKKTESKRGDEIMGRYIVSNAAARQTFYKLVGEENLGRKFLERLNQFEPTPPYCALFLGLDIDLNKMGFVPAIHIHSSTYDTEEHFRNLEPKMVNKEGLDPFFRFQLAPLSDPTSAPEGKSALVMHYIPAPSSGWDNLEWQKKVIDLMIRRAEKVIPDLSQHIVYQEFWSPVTIDKYDLCGQDTSMGWATTPKQIGPKRLEQQTPVKNLLLSGHWTRPAVGVVSVSVSGLQAAKMILEKEGIREPLADLGIKNGVMIQ